MGFQLRDEQADEFLRDGYTVFRSIIPPALLEDLRRSFEKAPELARARRGDVNSQRLQPLEGHGFDLGPFNELAELPELREAVDRVLGPDYTYFNTRLCGLLVEPGELPYTMAWHRDTDFFDPPVPQDRIGADLRHFNQLNCALYEDSSLWYVPGSYRTTSTPEQLALRDKAPELTGLSPAEREGTGLELCQAMPGAVCLFLNAGDFALYQNSGWHTGTYVHYKKRATLHDFVLTPEYAELVGVGDRLPMKA